MIPECYYCDKSTGDCVHPEWEDEKLKCTFDGSEVGGYACAYFMRL